MAPKRAKVKQYDVVLHAGDRESVALDIVMNLESKGYCVIDAGLEPTLLRKAADDAEACDSLGRWRQPPELLLDGLLGQEGSARILELNDSLEADEREISNLRKVDASLTDAALMIGEMLPTINLYCPGRTSAVVHETGMPPGDPPPLNEHEASDWLATFSRGRIMLLLVLGPTRGTLELRPFDEEAEEMEIPTMPGSIIALRADAMYHKHFAHSKALIMSCFLIEERGASKSFIIHQSLLVPPHAKAIEQWAIRRMKELKEEEAMTQQKLDIPKSWLSAMNHMFHTAQRTAVRGIAGRFPSTWDISDAYKMQVGGIDLVTEIPMARWNVDLYYDSDPEGWRRQKVYLRHGAFMDGVELFDNKFFGLSPMESSGMDPHQRLVLEVGYEALRHAGYKKGKLMNSIGGVYLGATASIFGNICSSGATGGAASITSNRFSFCLGLKGPSMTIDTEGSSSLSAVYLGAEAVLDKGRGQVNEFSLSGGVFIQLGTMWWPQFQAAGLLSPQGRCLTWDATADGYAMGDCCGFAVQKRCTEMVDGQQVYIEGEPLVGAVVASTMNSNGINAGLAAPSGPAEQEMVAEALRNAGLQPMNIDAVEVHGQAAFMADAIEVDSLMRVLRSEDVTEPLGLTAIKSRMGHAQEAAGIAGMIRMLQANTFGAMTPNCHLYQLNPHVEPESRGNFLTECSEFAMQASYTGVTSRGFGGTNVHVITYGQLDPARRPPPPANTYDQIIFWPGGGGELPEDAVPLRGYFITGSFNEWGTAKMENDSGDGSSYGFTVTLGENGYEDFQILLDGDASRCLHPGRPEALSGSAVCGPEEQWEEVYWRINGRLPWLQDDWDGEWDEDWGDWNESSELAVQPAGQAASSGGAKAEGSAEAKADLALAQVPQTVDRGVPGDRFRVQLRIAGKYRTVVWEKLEKEIEDMS